MEQVVVKKWWGENAAELRKSPENIKNDYENWIKNQVVVVSAIRNPEYNTTDNLILLWKLLQEKNIDYDIIKSKVEEIRDFHIDIAKKSKVNNFEKIKSFINKSFEELLLKIAFNLSSHNWLKPSSDNDYSIKWLNEQISILWFWENISAKIHTMIINNLKVEWLSAELINFDNVTKKINEFDTQNIIFEKLSKEISSRVDIILSNWNIAVITWYIPWLNGGIEKNIWRWYSDATSSMLATWLSENYNVILEIQKSVKWILSADPRVVNNTTKLIEQIDYLTAKEITWVRWWQAKLLHSQVLRKELLGKWIKVKLFDPFNDWKWTIISREKNKESIWVEYIWYRDNIIFFSISSWDMSDSWILEKVFKKVNDYNISVDIVSTSETEISFTIDNGIEKNILDSLVKDIQKELDIDKNDDINFVKYTKNKALIFCIWQNLSQATWPLYKASKVLSDNWINTQLMSQGSMERSMVFWVESWEAKKAVNILHKEFIE